MVCHGTRPCARQKIPSLAELGTAPGPCDEVPMCVFGRSTIRLNLVLWAWMACCSVRTMQSLMCERVRARRRSKPTTRMHTADLLPTAACSSVRARRPPLTLYKRLPHHHKTQPRHVRRSMAQRRRPARSAHRPPPQHREMPTQARSTAAPQSISHGMVETRPIAALSPVHACEQQVLSTGRPNSRSPERGPDVGGSLPATASPR